MKNLRKVICGAMAFVSMTIGTIGVIADESKWETHYVSAPSGLNCRVKPEIDNDNIIKVFPKGTELQIIGIDETGKWYEVWDGEHQGWCYDAYFVANKENLDKQTNTNLISGTRGKHLGKFRITGYTPDPYENDGYGVCGINQRSDLLRVLKVSG